MTMTDRPKTVLFTDVEGSTAFNSERGDAVAIALMRIHERAVRESAAEHDGWVVKSTGDGFLVVFPTPAAGVACALDVHARLNEHNANNPDSVLRVRMGLHSGTLVQQADDVFGLTVTIASRVTSKAMSGQLLVSDAVRTESLEGDWTYVDRGLFWLKGLVEQWRLFEATRGEPVAPPALDAALPFVNRDVERAALRRYAEWAGGGHGTLVTVAGNAGTGKTRLVEEVGIEADAGSLRFLVGRCHATGQTDPYAPLIEIVESVERRLTADAFRAVLADAASEMARLLPHIRQRYVDVPRPAEAPAQEQRRYLFMSIRDVLARLSAIRPLMILVDDVHWADGPTLMFLEHLAAELSTLPVLVVLTYRHEELPSATSLHATLTKLHQRHLVETMDLDTLTERDVEHMLIRIGGAGPPASLVQTLHGTTNGNPFFLGEVVNQLLAQRRLFDESGWLTAPGALSFEVPESVRFTIEDRLHNLQASTRGLLTAACPVGRDFGFDLLEALSDLSEDDLVDAVDEAERARLIASTVDAGTVRFSFAHELVRQTLLSQVTLTRRQRLHAGVADALEQVHTASLSEHAAAIAYHLGEAGRFADPDRTIRLLTIAGERALETAAFEDAVEHLRLVLPMVGDDPKARGPVLERLARAERSLGQLDDALGLWDDAIDAYESVDETGAAARVCLDAAIQVAWWRRGRDLSRLVERGLAMLGDTESGTRAGLLAVAGMTASQTGGYDRAEDLLDEALAIATRQHDSWIIGLTLYARSTHHFAYQEFREAVEVGIESVEYLRSASDMWNLANILGYVGAARGWLGRFGGAAELGREGEELANRLGNWSAFVFAEQARGFRDIGGKPANDTLAQRGRHALEMAQEMGFPWLASVGHARLGLAAFWRGDWGDALAEFERSADLEGGGAVGGQLGRLLLIHAYLGHREVALGLIDSARPQFPSFGHPASARSWNLAATAVEAFWMLGEMDEVAELYLTMSALASVSGSVMRAWDFRLVSTLQGMSAGCNGRWDEAETYFETALRQSTELPMLREEPEAQRFYAQMLIGRNQPGDRERAATMLEAALDAYTSYGMPRHAALTREIASAIP
jgi:class 3 adenylate cyclase/tetratricopeptide (TPR) repeat protein